RNPEMRGVRWMLLALHLVCARATHLAPMPCDSKSVEKLALLAMTYINEDRQTGYKFALNRVFNAHVHPQGPAGKVYYLDLDILETKCHVLSPKSWKRCEIRPFMETQISGNCNTTILHTTEGFSYLYSYDCTLVPDPPEKLQRTCPDCPLLLALGSDRAVSAAKTTLRRYTQQSTLPMRLTLDTITRASQQVRSPPCCFSHSHMDNPAFDIPDRGHLCGVHSAGVLGLAGPGGAVCACSRRQRGERQQPLHCAEFGIGRIRDYGDMAPIGFCTGAVFGPGTVQTSVKVSCEIFHPQRNRTSGDVGRGQRKKTLAGQASPVALPLAPDGHALTFEDAKQGSLQPLVISHPSSSPESSQSSESSEEESVSSEELVGSERVIRPPQDFRYTALRQKRQAPGDSQPSPSPAFLTVFPGTPSPFRSCPGVSRYTTV
ncbi:hypothetical protein P4O66_012825, partial [Electrophorus voltai]